jgi:hypothetical protein
MDSIHTQREIVDGQLEGIQYLTSDKMRPFQDVDDIELWVEDTRKGHDRRPVDVAADKTRQPRPQLRPHQSHLLDLQVRGSDAQRDLGIGIRQQIIITITASDYVVMLKYCTVLYLVCFTTCGRHHYVARGQPHQEILPLVALKLEKKG